MADDAGLVDYTAWDWLPQAADEIGTYLKRPLDESAITAHDVSARAKSIGSFNKKQSVKQYADPRKQVTDTVAVRIITYSVTDRDRAAELIRTRFDAVEDCNPGVKKTAERRGYDCHHFVVRGESAEAESGWLIAGGKLSKYFQNFGGLEIQIRTVAAHSWAEFEHSRRYKGKSYAAISDQDQKTIDILFGAAADARRSLDETFIVIDRILASPTESGLLSYSEDGTVRDASTAEGEDADVDNLHGPTALSVESPRSFLAARFPNDEEASDEGMQFACDLVNACKLVSIEALEKALEAVDSAKVRQLMDTTTNVTRVRRLDDELLARFGEAYIKCSGSLGKVKTRSKQLEWRYDRLRDKVPLIKYKVYEIVGADTPPELLNRRLSATGAVRELARTLADRKGSEAAIIPEAISEGSNNLIASARAKKVELLDGGDLWVATNLSRDYSGSLLRELLSRVGELDIHVEKGGTRLESNFWG